MTVIIKSKSIEDTIGDYINSMKHEVNPSESYQEDVRRLLIRFSRFFHSKSFKLVTREDMLAFLDSYRKPSDPLHKWIGTYNITLVHLTRFFRWLYYPDIYPSKDRAKPPVVKNIPELKRKETSIYKPTDMWNEADDALFLKYCPNPRERCYHAISRDSACRPHELLRLRIKDVTFKITADNKQYAEVVVNGKTGSRSVPLINSIPHLKDWIDQHPHRGNPNSILLCGFGRSINRVLYTRSLHRIYDNYKRVYFPKLLDNPNVPAEDKQKIIELLKKKWNPYVRRHSALTEKSGIIKEHHLRQYAGWSANSKMPQKYIHYFGNESSDSLLVASGIIPKDKQQSDILLKPKQCPQCSEPNKPDSKFCAKCRMVLTYDAYNETLEKQQEKEDKLSSMEKQFNIMQSQFQTLITSLGSIKDQNQINQTAQILYKSGILNLPQQK